MTNKPSMQVTLQNVGKRYNREWIFRHADFCLDPSKRYAITGSNGSGKSTLLQVIAGSLQHNEGSLTYQQNNQTISAEKLYACFSIVAPYLELIEEMTALEFLTFHGKFKSLTKDHDEILALVGLEKAGQKQIRYYSSGMKQRLKLAQAFFSETSLLLLDEPTTNLDQAGVQLYKSLIEHHSTGKLVVVCSNDSNEYDFCEEIIGIEQFKK